MTYEQLKNINPLIKSENIKTFLPFLNEWMAHYGITTPERQIHFIAQILHESALLRHIEENLNYSAEGLLKTFPRKFSKIEAPMYANHPDLIANRAYANKGGNGNEASGDGWRFRGRGLIQVSLRANYEALSKDWEMDVIANPSLLLVPTWAVRSACWFWWKAGLNHIADTGTVIDVTRKINPALLGLVDREKLYNQAKLFI